MKYNKQVIDNNIEALKIAVAMEADIREVLEKFKHYKQVNSKFVEALKDKGWFAYIIKSQWDTKLVISPNCNGRELHGIDVNFTLYVSHMMEKKAITWDLIERELKRHSYQDRLDKFWNMAKMFHCETVRLKELVEFFDKVNLTCFDFYYIKRDMKDLLEYATIEK